MRRASICVLCGTIETRVVPLLDGNLCVQCEQTNSEVWNVASTFWYEKNIWGEIENIWKILINTKIQVILTSLVFLI